MIVAWGVALCRAVCPGDRGGSDEMLSVRRQRAVLAKPQFGFRILCVRFVAKFCCIDTLATWCDTSNVVSRDAHWSAST
jgi:hypothetical protein